MSRWWRQLVARMVGGRRSTGAHPSPGYAGDHHTTEWIMDGPDALTAEFPLLDPHATYRADTNRVRAYVWMTEQTAVFRRLPPQYPYS